MKLSSPSSAKRDNAHWPFYSSFPVQRAEDILEFTRQIFTCVIQATHQDRKSTTSKQDYFSVQEQVICTFQWIYQGFPGGLGKHPRGFNSSKMYVLKKYIETLRTVG